MNIAELFPDAPLVGAETLKVGDLVAFSRNPDATEAVVATVETITEHGVPECSISRIPLDYGVYLIRRTAPALPTERGEMIRILNPGTTTLTHPGEVFTRSAIHRWETALRNLSFSTAEIESEGITWEQVWYTNLGPDCEGIVDAEVLEATPEEEAEMERLRNTLPTTPALLVRVESGPSEGALVRSASVVGAIYHGISASGSCIALGRDVIENAGWTVVTTIPFSDFV